MGLDTIARYPDFLTDRHIARFAGLGGGLGRFLHAFSLDANYLRDDFDGDTLNANLWTTNGGTGTTAFAIPSTPLLGGAMRGATGTDATASNRRVNFYGPAIYKGDNDCGMLVRFKSSRVSDLIIELGWLDTMTSITTPAPAVTDVDTPSFAAGAGDAALVVMDTGQTLTTMALACLGSGSLNAGSADAISTLAPTADTYMTVVVQLVGNNAVVIVDHGDGYTTQKAAGIEGGTLVRPWLFIGGGSTTTCTVDVDLIAIWQDRL